MGHIHSIVTKALIGGRVIRVWVLSDQAWLYPDDPGLWQLVLDGYRENTPVLVIARKIAPLTFPLLKAVGARGTQFYAFLSAKSADSNADAQALVLGLPQLMSVTKLRTHRVQEQIRNNIAALTDPMRNIHTPDKALADAIARGFGQPNEPTAASLLDWAEGSGIDWPEGWRADLRRLADPMAAVVSHISETSCTTKNSLEPDQETIPAPAARGGGGTIISRTRVAAEVDRHTWFSLTRAAR